MAKILYFINGVNPTQEEQAAIDAIPTHEVCVRSILQPALYGEALEPCDYVAGAIPVEYDNVEPYVSEGGEPFTSDVLFLISNQNKNQIQAIAVLTMNGNSIACDVTGSCTYESSDEAIATVDSSGHVTGITSGTVVITATVINQWTEPPETIVGTIELVDIINDPVLTPFLALLPSLGGIYHPIGAFQLQILIVTAQGLNDADVTDVTPNCIYTSSNEAVATVNSTGLVTPIAEGISYIEATYQYGDETELISIGQNITVDP